MILVEGAAMRMSKRSEYGLKAAVHLASHHLRSHPSPMIGGAAYLQSREIAEAEHLPPKFLESVLLSLRSAQILVSKVGAGGGYRLSRGPEQIRVHEVIDALEREHESETDPEDIGHTPTTLRGRPEPRRNGINGTATLGTGHTALQLLNRRIDDAVAGALGTLTLRELVTLSESRLAQG
ncbi:MAG: RrF2 family transcriptional regulator [Phycisphaerales bacterium]